MRKRIAILGVLTALAMTACGQEEPEPQFDVSLVAEKLDEQGQPVSDETTEEEAPAETDVTEEASAEAEAPAETAEPVTQEPATAQETGGAFPDWKSAYLETVEKANGEGTEQPFSYDLIYLDEDDIPELVVGLQGYYVNLYTYRNNQLVTLMDSWGYGAGGNAGYEYLPKSNLVRNYDSDYAGLVRYISYMGVNENGELSCKYYLKSSYEDENREVITVESEADMVEENWHYYLSTGSEESEVEISEEEFEKKVLDGAFEPIDGGKTYDQIKKELE